MKTATHNDPSFRLHSSRSIQAVLVFVHVFLTFVVARSEESSPRGYPPLHLSSTEARRHWLDCAETLEKSDPSAATAIIRRVRDSLSDREGGLPATWPDRPEEVALARQALVLFPLAGLKFDRTAIAAQANRLEGSLVEFPQNWAVASFFTILRASELTDGRSPDTSSWTAPLTQYTSEPARSLVLQAMGEQIGWRRAVPPTRLSTYSPEQQRVFWAAYVRSACLNWTLPAPFWSIYQQARIDELAQSSVAEEQFPAFLARLIASDNPEQLQPPLGLGSFLADARVNHALAAAQARRRQWQSVHQLLDVVPLPPHQAYLADTPAWIRALFSVPPAETTTRVQAP